MKVSALLCLRHCAGLPVARTSEMRYRANLVRVQVRQSVRVVTVVRPVRCTHEPNAMRFPVFGSVRLRSAILSHVLPTQQLQLYEGDAGLVLNLVSVQLKPLEVFDDSRFDCSSSLDPGCVFL